MSARLQAVLAANEDFAKAFYRNERWAVERAEQIRGIDGLASSRHPERVSDGYSRNWCGTCPYRDGCMTCDMDGDHKAMKGFVGAIATYKVTCDACDFDDTTESTSPDDATSTCAARHRTRRRCFTGKLSAVVVPGPFTAR